jgi:hypothetical protein
MPYNHEIKEKQPGIGDIYEPEIGIVKKYPSAGQKHQGCKYPILSAQELSDPPENGKAIQHQK